MTQEIKLVMAQLNFLVGDIDGNTDKIIEAAKQARDEFNADVIIFPELALSGYPPEDLLLRKDIYVRVKKNLERLAAAISGIDIIVGYPCQQEGKRYNCAGFIHDGKLSAEYFKNCLPNYSVFDEQRYFTAGNEAAIIDIKGIPTALTICEDLWHPGPTNKAKEAGAKMMICINASPFDSKKQKHREETAAIRAKEGDMPIIYVNLVGGQDELIFDGGSMVIDHKGKLIHQAPFYDELLEPITISGPTTTDNKQNVTITSQQLNPKITVEKRVYDALVLGVRDYIEKNRFSSAIIGLSGGIDSALTLAIAVDAIGADRVEAVMMPSRYTSQMSKNDSKEEAALLGVEYHTISIEKSFNAFIETLSEEFKDLPQDVTEENIQARCRAIILMAISNKKGAIVLSTGNKSELSVGYATLYGDMVGGFCVLKDVPKHWVYKLANYRNSITHVIPQNVIDRPPSAELAPGQLDQDTLPPYEILDKILEMYVEEDRSPQYIIDKGFEADTVLRVVKMVDRNEYKRHQAPVGVKISERSFGKDRRYPITSGYHS